MAGQLRWWDERDLMVAFALRWAPFGGGSSEDIWMAFGITEHTYFARLQIVLTSGPPPGLDDLMWERLRRVCADRLSGLAAPDSAAGEVTG